MSKYNYNSSWRNIKLWLKMKSNEFNEACWDYIIRHQLIDKYFNNFSNFNSNSLSLKENFNTFNNLRRKSFSPAMSLDGKSYLIIYREKK